MGGRVLDTHLIGKPREKHWIRYIKMRIKNNKNFLGFISGPTGSGKSWSTLSICNDLDPNFSVDQVVFSGLELMQLINGGTLRRGSAIAFEEAGVELSHQNWQSVTNKMLNYLVQTFRHRGYILIMNSPHLDFVDASTRKLFHAELQTIGLDLSTNECKLKPQLLQYNGRYRKFYYKRLKVITREGNIPVSVWKIPKPSKELIKAYEEKKHEYTAKLNKRILSELQTIEHQSKGVKPLTQVQEEVVELLKSGLTVKEIADKRGRNESSIQESMQLIKRKGYTIKAIHDDVLPQKVSRYEVLEPEL